MSDRDEDAIWLDALSGKSERSEDSRTEKEAQLIRAALARRAQKLDAVAPEAESTLLSQILFRLRRERAFEQPGLPRVPIWLAAASIVLAVVLTLQIQRTPVSLPVTDQDLATMATKITASAPTQRALEIVAELKSSSEDGGLAEYREIPSGESKAARLPISPGVSSEPGFLELSDGRVVVVIDASPSAIQALQSQGIEPTVVDGLIILVIGQP